MLAAAARLLYGWRILDPLEALGARAWRGLLPAHRLAATRSGTLRAIAFGLAWGALPCAMTYSMLLLAATSASATGGAAVMLAFGAGTLPAMLATSLLLQRGRGGAGRRAAGWQSVAGALLLLFGLWTAGNALWHARPGVTQHEHQHLHGGTANDAAAAEARPARPA
jgi:sulfite exporter TauE/SafE